MLKEDTEDTTPWLASAGAVAMNNALAIKRRRYRSTARKMIGEEDARDLHRVTNPERHTWNTDCAIFYYPGVSEGIIVDGPINMENMCVTFAKEYIPGLVKSMKAKADIKSQPVSLLIDEALDYGMVVVAGMDDEVTVVMSKHVGVSLPDNGSTVWESFESVAPELVHMTSYGHTSSSLVRASKLVPCLAGANDAERVSKRRKL